MCVSIYKLSGRSSGSRGGYGGSPPGKYLGLDLLRWVNFCQSSTAHVKLGGELLAHRLVIASEGGSVEYWVISNAVEDIRIIFQLIEAIALHLRIKPLNQPFASGPG
jgi:hypothetical protein